MKKVILGIFASSIIAISAAQADVVAFGLTMGKSTESDLKSLKCKFHKEKSKDKRILIYSANGSCYKINGLKKVFLTFVDKKVKFIDALFNKDEFNTIKDSLENKYGEPSDSQIPFVGDTFVEWQPENENLLIRLDAPHLSFDMELFYINNDYLQELSQKKNNSDHINSKQRESVL